MANINQYGTVVSVDEYDQVFVSDAGTALKKAGVDAIAKYVIEDYTGSAEWGAAQSVQDAIVDLNALLQGRQYGSIDAMYPELISLLAVNQTVHCTATGNLVASLTNSEITKVCRVEVVKADTTVLDYMLFAPGSNAIYIGRINADKSVVNRNRFATRADISKTTLSTTQTYANATAETYNYQTITGLSDYAIVLVNVNCANLRQTLTFVNGDTDPQYLYEINGNNKIRGGYSVDWTNNRVGVRYLSAAGAYTYQNVYFTKVVGFIKQ